MTPSRGLKRWYSSLFKERCFNLRLERCFGKTCHKKISSRTVTEGSQIRLTLFDYPSAAISLNLSNMACLQDKDGPSSEPWLQRFRFTIVFAILMDARREIKVDSNCNTQDGYFSRGTQNKPIHGSFAHLLSDALHIDSTKSRPFPEKVSSFIFQCYRFVT